MIRIHTAAATGLATVLAAGALAAPSAIARPADLGVPHTHGSISAAQPASGADDLRSPDARDAAQGRQVVASTPVEVVRTKHSTPTGFDWGDAAIGAGGAMAAVLACLGGTMALTRRRPAVFSTSKASRLAG
jgi:hypothetical protein